MSSLTEEDWENLREYLIDIGLQELAKVERFKEAFAPLGMEYLLYRERQINDIYAHLRDVMDMDLQGSTNYIASVIDEATRRFGEVFEFTWSGEGDQRSAHTWTLTRKTDAGS